MRAEPTPICALCWIDGVRSVAIKGWDGFPVCRTCLSATQALNSPYVPAPTVFTAPTMTLQ